MTNVISLASRRAVLSVHANAPVPTFKPAPASPAPASDAQGIERLQGIENALSIALFYIRQNEEPRNIHAATVKAVRAAAMLKQACAVSASVVGGA